MPSKKSARIVCGEGSFWVTPKQFWRWVRESLVEFNGERPLSGTYHGRLDDFLITIEHTILDASSPMHLHEALRIKRKIKRRSN